MIYLKCSERNRPGKEKDPGTRPASLALVLPKGELMKPMKKPVRLLGMVFQIDK
jgi:hypothetical protein